MKKISCLLSVLLLLALVTKTLGAGQKTDKPATTIEHIRSRVAKLGVGSKARATITVNNSAKVKGYVYSAGDEEFVIRNRKTDAPTRIRYADVKKIDDNRGHSLARNILIAVGIGAAVTLTAVYLAIVRHER